MPKVERRKRERSERKCILHESRGRKPDGNIWRELKEKPKQQHTQKEENDSPNNMGVTSTMEPKINYQERHNVIVKDHKIKNVTPQIVNIIMIYTEITKEI